MICKICGINIATQRHHKFSQTKKAKKCYGSLLDADFNIIYVCENCHISHRNIPKKYIWNEERFRIEAEFAKCDLPEPMKSYKREK